MTILEVLSSKPLDFVLPLVEREGYSMNRIGFDLHSTHGTLFAGGSGYEATVGGFH